MWRDHLTFRSWGGTARVTYDPQWSPTRPWGIFIDGTAVTNRASLMDATFYCADRHGAVMPVNLYRAALIESARWRSAYLRGRDWSSNAAGVYNAHFVQMTTDASLPPHTQLQAARAIIAMQEHERTGGTTSRNAWTAVYRAVRCGGFS